MPTEPTPRDAVAGELYVVRSNAPIKITQTNDLGTLVMLDITEENGTNGNEVCFTAINGTDKMHVTAEGVYAITRGRGFNHGGAAASGTAGGTTVDITFDTTPTEGSTNAVTSGGTFALSLHPSVGKDSLASGVGAVAYCADSLAIGEGAVVGALYETKSKSAKATQKETTPDSENSTSWNEKWSHNSVALGLHAQASGLYSTALGNFATAGSTRATASGSYATASGSYATASGSYATASGYSATASGSYATASGSYATASGYSATASGYSATASGYSATASGYSATASGYSATASGSYATASGSYATASGSYATASGSYATAPVTFGTSYGCKSTVQGEGGFVLGALGVNADPGNGVLTVMSDIPSEMDESGYWSTYFDTSSGCWYGLPSSTIVTQFYIIGAGTPLANQYTNGEAGLGFVEVSADGTIRRRGCRKLSDLLTDHTTDFTPTLQFENVC